jgi:hypothetical protein
LCKVSGSSGLIAFPVFLQLALRVFQRVPATALPKPCGSSTAPGHGGHTAPMREDPLALGSALATMGFI